MVSLHPDRACAYEADYLRWLDATLAQLRQGDYAGVDWEHLLEELEDMGRRERRSLESNLIIVLLHLLKWQFQPERRSGSWESSIIEHRRRLRRALEDSPSLKPYCLEVLTSCYEVARDRARAETGLPLITFPGNCPYDLAQALDPQFLP